MIRFSPKDQALIDRALQFSAPQIKRGITVMEGSRILSLGATGSGKTSFERACVYSLIDRGWADFGMVHDTKGVFPEYPRSVQLACIEDFQRRGFQPGDIPVVSFRGDPRRGIRCPVEEVASWAMHWLQHGKVDSVTGVWMPAPMVLVVDELAAASMPGRKHSSSPAALWFAEQGRKVGGSFVASTQSPRKCPLDFMGQANVIVYFRMTGADANYLGNVLELNPELVQTVRGPTGEGLPNHQFCMQIVGEPWDGEIHQLDRRTALMFE